MPWHTVKQGEDLKKILGRHYGFMPNSRVMEHPENRELFSSRDGIILNEGDRVFIPEMEAGRQSVNSDSSHRFIFRGMRKLQLTLKEDDDSPMANKDYRLMVDGKWLEGQTDGEGKLQEMVPCYAEKAKLVIDGSEIEIDIAHLDPIDTVTGVQARLSNLGYLSGEVDGKGGERTRAALKQFQAKYKLEETGEITDETRAKLKEVYGT